MNSKTSRLQVGFFLGGIALLIVFSQIRADTGQPRDVSSIESQQALQSYVWIQDPYTGDSVLTVVPEQDKSL